MPGCCKTSNCCCPVMDDCLAKKVECIWKEAFCDATILPCIGYPSYKCSGVMTLTHGMDMCPPTINGLTIKSLLANNALYSAEVSDGKWVNLYEIMIPDIPGKCGCKSSGEVYDEALIKLGISVEGDHYHWKGMRPFMLAIHSKNIGMDPCEFSQKQISAIKAVMKYIKCCH